MLRGVSLQVSQGERVLLAGPSGSGKSTLLRALTGLLGSVEAGELTGSVTLDGHPIGSRPGEVGLVLQEPGAGVVASTVARDVAFGLENIGMPRAAMPAVVTSALHQVGLDDLGEGRHTDHLSGGETQRLALAGALALQPEVLLLDEPTAMLDPASAELVRAAVAAVMDSGVTTIVVEHDLGPWVGLVDRLIVLSPRGEVVADGPVEQTLASHRDLLLEMGVWVPGAGVPDPVEPPPHALPDLVGAEPLRATPLTVGDRARTEDRIDAAPGSLTALVGPSGSGKSTILHTLAGFTPPTTGSVTTGTGLSPTELAARLAWVPQWSSSTIIAGTVIDEVLLTSAALGHDLAQARPRAQALLAALGLGHLEQADPRHLSGGEQRRLAIAAALTHGPPTLLVDEPTIGQDRHTWAALVGLVAAYRERGGAVVAATHDRHIIGRAQRVLQLAAPPGPRESRAPRGLVDRCGALALLAASMLGVPAGVLSPHWHTTLFVIAAQAAIALVVLGGRLPRLPILLAPGLLAAVSVGWSTWWLSRDVDAGLTAAARVLAVVVPSATLVPAIDSDELGDQAAQLLRLPDRPVVAVAAALQRVQSFGEIWRELARARRVRGLGASWRRPGALVAHLSALTMGLLVRTLRYAADLAVAMDARGFARAFARTWWGVARWRWADTALVLAYAVPVAIAVGAR